MYRAISEKDGARWADPALCDGCGVCQQLCPVNAITGEIKKPYVIDSEKCIKCGACYEKCKFGAISIK